MADLGASVNILPRSMFNHLKLTNLKETNLLVEMADMAVGIVENVLVKIDKFLFHSDFMIIDMLGDPNETMIIGRPLLATIHARIDVFDKEISLGVGEDIIVFDMNGNVYHSVFLIKKVLRNGRSDVKSYFPNTSQENQIKPLPRNYSFKEWLKLKIGHTNVNKIVKNAVLNEWVLDCFKDESETSKDAFSRSLEEYKLVFDIEIEQLADEYKLGIGKKGYVLDDI
ncbi:DNA-binding pseudobarrel domain-containing protein [Tanacetum coccineum]